MRVGVFIENLRPSRGGRERSTAELSMGLARLGHDVEVVCMSGQSPGQGVRICPVGCHGITRAARFANYVADAQVAVGSGRFDMTHAVLPIPGADIYQIRGGTTGALLRARERTRSAMGRRFAALIAPMNRLRSIQGRFELETMRDHRTWCLPVSQLVADELKHFYGRSRNVRVVYNGVDMPEIDQARRAAWRRETREAWGVGESEVLWLCPAMDFRRKALAETIEVFAALQRSTDRPTRLVVLGRQSTKPYRALAARRGVGPVVLFPGTIGSIWQALAAADAVVLLSWYDPCSRVILEAVRFGLPSVTTRLNGAAEALTDGAGVVVDSPAERTAAAEAMRRLTEESTDDVRAACAAKADALSMERHVVELARVYEEIAASRRSR